MAYIIMCYVIVNTMEWNINMNDSHNNRENYEIVIRCDLE